MQKSGMNKTPLLLQLGMSQCVICGKDAEECEHAMEPEQDFDYASEQAYERFNGTFGEYETDAERNR